MTPELPRAPRSRVEAVMEAACSTVAGLDLRSSRSCCADGHGHVGSGVAVGYRKHVEVVDGLLLGSDGSGTVQNHLLEHQAGNLFIHLFSVLPYRVMESTHTSTALTVTPVFLVTM